jgi:hypothetical protein
LSWRRLVLIILEEISPERRDDSRRKRERKKKCSFVHWPGIELEIGWISTSRPSQWAVMGSHNLT